MSSNEDSDIENAANCAIECLVPSKSRVRYEVEYRKFEEWCSKKNVESVSEKVMLEYFSEKAECEKPSSLWTHYSMIRSILFLKKKVDISKYMQLYAFLKRKGEGYQAKKSSIFSKENIQRFLLEADDKRYLMMKVALIIGIFGACRREELKNLTLGDIDDRETFITITLPKTKTKVFRQFVITKGNISGYDCLENVRKYFHLRPITTTHDRVFVYYKDGKCTSQPVGINTFGQIPKLIATYLGLTNPGSYTGHCFRRSSGSLLADAGADIRILRRHRRWKSSSIAEGKPSTELGASSSTAPDTNTENDGTISGGQESFEIKEEQIDFEHLELKNDESNPDVLKTESNVSPLFIHSIAGPSHEFTYPLEQSTSQPTNAPSINHVELQSEGCAMEEESLDTEYEYSALECRKREHLRRLEIIEKEHGMKLEILRIEKETAELNRELASRQLLALTEKEKS